MRTTTKTTVRTTPRTTPKTTTKSTKPPTTTIKTTTTANTTTTPKTRAEMTTSTIATLQYDTTPIMRVTTPSTTKSTTTPRPPPPSPLPPKLFEVASLPDKQFWIILKQLYYYGCNNAKVRPILCHTLNASTQYTDLTQYELPDTNDFKHMDQNLLIHLRQAEQTLNLRPDIDLSIEKLFPFILYGIDESARNKKMPSTMENGYRFVLCLYIDTILLDRNLNLTFVQNLPSENENVTQKLKYYLIRIASKVSVNYPLPVQQKSTDDFAATLEKPITNGTQQNNANVNEFVEMDKTMASKIHLDPIMSKDLQSTSAEIDEQIISHMKNTTSKNPINLESTAESETVDESCHLELLPETSPNSYITAIKVGDETIFNMPDRLYLIGPVSIRTRAYLACSVGFKSVTNSIHYYECNESLKWIGQPIQCEGNYHRLHHHHHHYDLCIQFNIRIFSNYLCQTSHFK